MKTVYQANRDLGVSFGKATNPPPNTYYVGLSVSSTVTELGFTEPTGGSYARVALVNESASFTTANAKSISTNIAITFDTSTSAWGTIYAIGLFDALTGGNMLYYEELTITKEVVSGIDLRLSAGALTITEV